MRRTNHLDESQSPQLKLNPKQNVRYQKLHRRNAPNQSAKKPKNPSPKRRPNESQDQRQPRTRAEASRPETSRPRPQATPQRPVGRGSKTEEAIRRTASRPTQNLRRPKSGRQTGEAPSVMGNTAYPWLRTASLALHTLGIMNANAHPKKPFLIRHQRLTLLP